MCKVQFYPTCDFYSVIGADRTLTYLNDLVEMNPKDAKAWMLRGNVHDDSPGESGKALRDYSIAIAIDPTYAEAYVKRSSTHDDRGEHQQAVQDADEAIRLNPDIAVAYVNRASALAALGRDTEAASDQNAPHDGSGQGRGSSGTGGTTGDHRSRNRLYEIPNRCT